MTPGRLAGPLGLEGCHRCPHEGCHWSEAPWPTNTSFAPQGVPGAAMGELNLVLVGRCHCYPHTLSRSRGAWPYLGTFIWSCKLLQTLCNALTCKQANKKNYRLQSAGQIWAAACLERWFYWNASTATHSPAVCSSSLQLQIPAGAKEMLGPLHLKYWLSGSLQKKLSDSGSKI